MQNASCDKLWVVLLQQLLHNISYVGTTVSCNCITRAKIVENGLIRDLGLVQATLQHSLRVDICHCVLEEAEHPRVEEILVRPDVCAEALIPVFYNVLQKRKEDRILELTIDSIWRTVVVELNASQIIWPRQVLRWLSVQGDTNRPDVILVTYAS